MDLSWLHLNFSAEMNTWENAIQRRALAFLASLVFLVYIRSFTRETPISCKILTLSYMVRDLR